MLTEQAIRALTNPQSFARGAEYCDAGMVLQLIRRGPLLTASVSGSGPRPYQVAITFDGDRLLSATCDCPYDWGDHCKHVVAVLLAALRQPEQVEARPTIEDLLSGLDADALRKLLIDLVAQHPEITAALEVRVARLTSSPAEGRAAPRRGPRPAVDIQLIRRLIRSATNARYGDYGYGAASAVTDSLTNILDLAQTALKDDDSAGALLIVAEIADSVIPDIEEFYDDEGELGGLFESLGLTATEALLAADLSAAERASWEQRLAAWQQTLSNYGYDAGFGSAIAAARQGWDSPELKRKLAGTWTAPDEELDEALEDDEDDEDDGYKDEFWDRELTAARLNVLERQGRIEEFLNLALAEGEDIRYAIKLSELGRFDEALAHGERHFVLPEQALSLAQDLHQRGQTLLALRIGARGLELLARLPGDNYWARGRGGELGRWLREVAESAGDAALALAAARAAFEEDHRLADYQAVARLAGNDWPALRPHLLAHFQRRVTADDERIDIYLAEGMIDAAIRAVDDPSASFSRHLSKVAAAAMSTRPDWVIKRCRQRAEAIMDAAQSKYYPDALHWLEFVRGACLAAARPDEWRAYRAELLAKHHRKYKLVPGLQQLT